MTKSITLPKNASETQIDGAKTWLKVQIKKAGGDLKSIIYFVDRKARVRVRANYSVKAHA